MASRRLLRADFVEKLREYWSLRNFLIESPGSLNRCVRMARRVEPMLRKLRAKNVFQQHPLKAAV